MMVRSRDDIYRMADLKGKKIGLSKSLNTIKNDWWRIQEEQGIELMLRLNGMTRKDVQIVEFPYPDDWYDKPEMMGPLWRTHPSCGCSVTTSTTWPSVRWKPRWRKARSTRCIPRAGPFQQLSGGDGQVQGDRGPLPLSGLDPAGSQHPRRHHLHRRDGREASRSSPSLS